MKTYKTDNSAAAAAKKRGEFGVTGRGQSCGPVAMNIEQVNGEYVVTEWGFRTCDGRVLIPGGEITNDEYIEYSRVNGVL